MSYDMSGAQRYEFKGKTKAGKDSHKFWIGKTFGTVAVVHFGKVNTDGQFRDKRFGSPAEAEEYIEKKKAEKTRKGYKPV
jgi:predicted DNA-binding WGR domain protein